MTAGIKLFAALGWYHTKRTLKNIYMYFWLAAVAGSILLVSNLWPSEKLNPTEWSLNSVNSGIIAACLLLPFIIRSFSPGFTAAGGTEFMGSRTLYLKADTAANLLVNVLTLMIMGNGGVILAAYISGIPFSEELILPVMLVNILPTLLLFTAIILNLLIILRSSGVVLIFWTIWAGLSFIPGLAPWGGLVWLGHINADLYSPLMLVNRLFCLLAAALLIYIFTVLQKNQISGVITTRLRYNQSEMAEAKAVIITGKGLVLNSRPGWATLKQEIKIMGYFRWLLGWAGAAALGILAHNFLTAAITGMGILLIFISVILSPRDYQDRLLPTNSRRKWKFIFIRVILALVLVLSMLVIFSLLGPRAVIRPIWFGFFVVWGWAWLGVHYWPMMGVRIGAALFWLATIFFPGALNMTVTSPWWPLSGLLLIFTAIVLYRRQLLPY